MKRALALSALLAACAGPAGEAEDRGGAAAPASAAVHATGSGSGSAAAPGSAAASVAGSASAAAAAAGSASAAAAAPAAASASASAAAPAEAAPPYAADNKILPPPESAELTERARGLFDAIVRNEPAPGEAFWFPKEPFIPLKDVKGPDKYWDNLHATYVNDIRTLHRKRKSWEGARFVGFQIGSKPKWVPPGDEVNKIGYYRSFHGKLRYELDGEARTIDVHTVISWQGRWYITHLNPFKKKK